MWKMKLPLVLLAMLLSGCETGGRQTEPPPPIVTDTACSWTKPIFVRQGDVLTDATAAAILAHNETGAIRCGWKPRAQK